MWGMFAARVQFVLCGLATIYLTHYMMSTTIYGVPTEEGCVSSGRLSRVLWDAEMDELYYQLM
jgi:hypothetical protein